MQKLKDYGGVAAFGVVTILLICLMAGIRPTIEIVVGFFVIVLAICVTVATFFKMLDWANKAKDAHEKLPNDGSLNYRISQLRYLIAIVVLGAVWLLLLYAMTHYRGRGN